jgi:hypothetical protein
MAADPLDYEAQDAAEAFDEDNTEGDDISLNLQEKSTFEELPDVFDETQKLGDGSADGRAYDDGEFRDGLVEDEDVEGDTLAATAEVDPYGPEELDITDDEVELEFVGDVEDTRGAQASAAHFESRQLTDEDLQQLGYQDKPAD